jgi:N utilization substance protein A
MSLAIGKKGQNVRLAAKLVKWRIDIKGESDATGDVATPDIFSSSKASTSGDENFLEVVTNTKGFGEKFVALLFTANVVSFEEVIKRGVEGMVEVPGIGPKKAEAIVNFATTWMEEKAAETPEEIETEVDEPSAIASENEEVEEASSEVEEDDDQDLPLSDLTSIDGAIIELLEKSGFQTIAELSVTPPEELTVIEGINEEEANSILEQARQHMENFEQV